MFVEMPDRRLCTGHACSLRCSDVHGQHPDCVNPFMKIPHLYSPHMMDQYKGVKLGELSPHVFAIAESSYRCRSTWPSFCLQALAGARPE